MRFEYIVVVASVALASAGSVAGLGSALGHAIGQDTAPSKGPRHAAPSAYVTSAQAGAESVARVAGSAVHVLGEGSAFRRLPVALQREAADAAALQDFLHRANRATDAAVHSGDFSNMPMSVRNLVPEARVRYLADAGDLHGVADEILAHPHLAEGVAPASTESYATETLRTAGRRAVEQNMGALRRALVAEGSVARAIQTRVPTLGQGAIDQFMAWSTEWIAQGDRRFTKLMTTSPVPNALTALLKGDLLTFRNRTAFVVHPVERGFAIPLDDLPEAIGKWRSVTDPNAPSTVIRDVMAPNLTFLERQATEHLASLQGDIARWGDAAAPQREALDAAIAYTRAHREALAAAVASPTLSQREAFRLFDGSLGLNDHKPSRLFASMATDPQWFFPFASETEAYWSYARVADWHEVGTYPVEVPMVAKIDDLYVDDPLGFAMHDASAHITSGIQRRLLEPPHQAKIASLRALLSEVKSRSASPEVVQNVKDYLGFMVWEGDMGVRSMSAARGYGDEARRILAQWHLDTSDGSSFLEEQARNVLEEIP